MEGFKIMTNYKRKKPRDSKVYRNGADGRGCPYCGSNWQFANSASTNVRVRWENMLDGTDNSSWRFW